MDPGTHPLSSIQKNAYKRRFTDEQIKFLEFMFESESRPESRVKQQLASELGLEPRQVAIWFQNRRARLKTKQIEKEYSILKASYDVLASSFESLKREKQSLIIQLQKLKNRQHGSRNCENQLGSSRGGRFENKDTGSESKDKPSSPLDGNENEENRPSSDNNSVNMREEIDILNHTEQTDNSSQWWEFWS
ncbi:PREDICTED: homeobox-leucine zipper protein ATHB-12-like [Populus euphratica]|uniref:Homeobox-leucine zipper protein n=1 Tax=Populus euphratica TaxID=75702 RepID=A0AAJ6XQ60_POPEU|nr:PREDICTED: homeobox-leucine zipper protein ATHB-12-like [Populus euphratica]